MAELKIESEDDFEKWLEGKPREVCVVLASRIALRVFPLVGDASFIEDFGEAIVLPTLWANTLSWAADKYPIRVENLDFIEKVIATAAIAADVVTGADDAVDPAVFATAANACDAAAAAAYAITASAPSAVPASKYALRALQAATHTTQVLPTFWDALRIDCRLLQEEGDYAASTLANMPLWPDEVPGLMSMAWHSLTRALLRADDSWQVWINWYEARLHGRPIITAPADIVKGLDLDIALIDETF